MNQKISIPYSLKMFHKVASHPLRTVFGLIAFNIASIVMSFTMRDFNWFAASGGVTTIFGVLLTVSHSVPKTDDDIQNYVASMFPKSRDGIMPEIRAKGKDQKATMITAANKVLKAESLGLIITITGTLIWAYSGFLTGLLLPVSNA
ncbi:MAG: hypothetical protein V7765_17100 [Oleispira sp.]